MSSNPYLFKFWVPKVGHGGTRSTGSHGAFGLGSNTAAPILINQHGFWQSGSFKSGSKQLQLVDVVNNFDWTHTGGAYRHEVPYIRMSELSVNFNSIRQQLKYMLSSGILGADTAGFIADMMTVKQEKAADKWWEEQKDAGLIGEKDDGGAASKMYKARKKFDGNLDTTIDDSVAPKHLRPYYGLYGVASTGFEYAFPYFTADGKSVDSTWGDLDSSSHGGAISDIIKSTVGPEGFAKTIVDNLAIKKDVLGTYIERAQIYSTQEGPSHTFGFTLFNTGSIDSIVRNWHLQYMLAYQNLPNKLSKVNVDPPVIYEVEIPGMFYSPFAYISSLKISHQGATRTMNIPYFSDYKQTGATDTVGLPNSKTWDKIVGAPRNLRSGTYPRKTTPNHGEVEQIIHGGIEGAPKWNTYNAGVMIIPDAYRIEITIKSMVPESKNLFFHSALGQGTRSTGLYGVTINQSGAFSGDASRMYNRPTGHVAETLAANERQDSFGNIAWETAKEMGSAILKGGEYSQPLRFVTGPGGLL